MSKIQDLRDKIHRKDGQPFKLRDLNSTDKRTYFNLRELVKMRELNCEGEGRNTVFTTTSSLKIRKAALDLKGWREVFPEMFIHREIKGNTITHKVPMV